MNISNNVLNSITMLDSGTIDIEKITKELCVQICQDTGIETSNVLEEAVSSILTKYKNKEINNDDILEYLKKIYNNPIAYSTGESNNVTPSNHASSQNSENSSNNQTSKENNSTITDKNNSNSYNKQTSNSNNGNSGNNQTSKENNSNSYNSQTSNTNDFNNVINNNPNPSVIINNQESEDKISSSYGLGLTLKNTNVNNDKEKTKSNTIKYNESMISDSIAKIKECSSIPENALTEITKVVNSGNYYGSNTSGIGVVQNIINISSGFQSYLGNVRDIYDTAFESLLEFVQNLGNIDVSTALSVLFQNSSFSDEQFKSLFDVLPGTSTITRVPDEIIIERLERNGATKVSENEYAFVLDGVEYKYIIEYKSNTKEVKDAKIIFYENGKKQEARCAIFASNKTSGDLSNVNKTITFIPGIDEAGSNVKKVLGKKYLGSDVTINDNTLLGIVQVDSPANKGNCVAADTRLLNFISGNYTKNSDGTFAVNNKVETSVVGFSAGGLAAFNAASKNPGLYNNLVSVNSSTYGADGRLYVTDYDAFKDMNIYLLVGNDRYTSSIPTVVSDMINNGVSKEQITVYTQSSEKRLIEQLVDSNHLGSDDNIYLLESGNAQTDPSTHGGWNGHMSGYSIIRDMNVFSWLSE